MTRAILTLLFVVAFAAGARADFQAGLAAYDEGDYAAARAEWTPLAEAGELEAQHRLAGLYLRGEGVAQDFAQAAEWLGQAAKGGHPEAQATLAGLYATGLGVERNAGLAYFWMIVSALWDTEELRQAAMRSLGDVAEQLTPEEKAAIAKQAVPQWKR